MNQPLPHQPAYALPAPEMELRAVQRLGRRTARDGMYVGLILALLGHTAAVASPDYTLWMTHMVVAKMNRELKAYFDRTEEIDVVADKPKPAPEPEKVEEADIAPPDPVETDEPIPLQQPLPTPDVAPKDDPYDDYKPAAAAAAEAQDVLTTEGPVDMTSGWDMVDNDGSKSRATGASSQKGTAQGHVGNPNARPDGREGGTGTGPAKPAPAPRVPKEDRSQIAKPLTSLSSCPFPAQANLNQIDNAIATISVVVSPAGTAKSASVSSDPGYGFGAQAKRCAMGARYQPAKNRDGVAITQTIAIRFRFQR